jgi:hypothetical protein
VGNMAYAQTKAEPWSNIKGIRIGGQLIPFETNFSLVNNNWSVIKATAQEHQKPKYIRDGNKQIVTTKIDSVSFIETIEDGQDGMANVNVAVSSNSVVKNDAVFFVLTLPLKSYTQATGIFNSSLPWKYFDIKLKGFPKDFAFTIDSINLTSKNCKLQFFFDKPTEIIFKKNIDTADKTVRVYFSQVLVSKKIQLFKRILLLKQVELSTIAW